MTQDEIMELADKAGLVGYPDDLERFVTLLEKTKLNKQLCNELLKSLIEVLDQAVGWLDDSTGHEPDGLEWYEKAKLVINKAQELLK